MNGTKINASKYTPQLPHWSQDLSKWNNSASVMQALNSDSDKLKHNETLLFVNDDYCEISRRRPNARYHHLLFRCIDWSYGSIRAVLRDFFSVYHRYRRNY